MEQKTISGAEMAAKIERQIPQAKKEIEDFIDSLLEKYHVMSLANAIVQVADPYAMQRMTLNEYQKRAMKTCMPSSNNFSYMFLNLVGEVGEFASKVAKAIRKGEAYIATCDHSSKTSELYIYNNTTELQKEAGDILWQLSGLCSVMGWSLEDIAQQNLDKLASRQERNVIDGNGDNR